MARTRYVTKFPVRGLRHFIFKTFEFYTNCYVTKFPVRGLRQ